MKRVMTQLAFLKQVMMRELLIFTASIFLFPLLFTVMMYFTTGDGSMGRQDLDMYYIIYIWITLVGILLSTRLFKLSMKIRADRKPYIVAMVLVGELFAVCFGLCFYGVGLVVEGISQQVPRLAQLTLIGSGALGKMVFSFSVFMMIGLLLGAISNKLPTRIAIGGGIFLFLIIGFSQVGDVRSFLLMADMLEKNIVLAWGIIVVGLVLTTGCMLSCPLDKVSKMFKKKGDLCE